jgi:hypothetical protein
LGRDEGRILGLEKGFDIGYEVGMYMGCVLVIKSQRMDVVNRNTARDSKMYRHVDALLSYIDGGAATMWWDPHVRCYCCCCCFIQWEDEWILLL